ncbi:hypothetical protein B0H67DRAFT_86636 [Lasiosphaeris hirsuta]|uniref:Uncharacterized protein n=1 Tax=Lasiosphaeris hirsuta TaxID=260670 RepID=A0AA40BCJ4_9PEZI|nr:hypothetical protein B0H67DRAFT_86636 [Lasiosphaeris hirsuta]
MPRRNMHLGTSIEAASLCSVAELGTVGARYFAVALSCNPSLASHRKTHDTALGVSNNRRRGVREEWEIHSRWCGGLFLSFSIFALAIACSVRGAVARIPGLGSTRVPACYPRCCQPALSGVRSGRWRGIESGSEGEASHGTCVRPVLTQLDSAVPCSSCSLGSRRSRGAVGCLVPHSLRPVATGGRAIRSIMEVDDTCGVCPHRHMGCSYRLAWLAWQAGLDWRLVPKPVSKQKARLRPGHRTTTRIRARLSTLPQPATAASCTTSTLPRGLLLVLHPDRIILKGIQRPATYFLSTLLHF